MTDFCLQIEAYLKEIQTIKKVRTLENPTQIQSGRLSCPENPGIKPFAGLTLKNPDFSNN